MRKLPVYLLLDTSSSMMGEKIEAVRQGTDLLFNLLIQDPYALETAFLSVITFDSSARQVTPLTALTDFQVPKITASGVTALGEALTLAADCIEREVAKTTASVKGDWRPLVFVMTDGGPTDDFEKGLARFKQVKCGSVIACGAGGDADLDVLRRISETVVSLSTADSASIKAFFKWVSASVSATSKRIDLTKSDQAGPNDLPPPPAQVTLV